MSRTARKFLVATRKSLQGHLSARELSIIWGSDTRYWKWEHVTENMRGDRIEVAELIDVCWLQIDGKYDWQKLKEGMNYEVHFVVELKNNLVMNGPVNLTLTLPDGKTHERKEDLNCMPKNKWIGLKVGEFTAKPNCGCEDLKFTMMNTTSTWKKGLVVIGAVIFAKV